MGALSLTGASGTGRFGGPSFAEAAILVFSVGGLGRLDLSASANSFSLPAALAASLAVVGPSSCSVTSGVSNKPASSTTEGGIVIMIDFSPALASSFGMNSFDNVPDDVRALNRK